MKLRSVHPHFFVGFLACLAFNVADTQAGDDSKSDTAKNRVEPLLQAMAAGKKLDGDASARIPDLIVIVENGEIQESELAIRALTCMGSKASPAIAAICKKLDDPTHAMRSAAVDALAAVGDECIVPVRKLLNSPKGRTRASATQVLVRLKSLDLNDLAKLAKDSDPRVRAATANPLSRLGKPGVPPLADMLQDSDLSVSVEAARALQSNRADPSIAVPRLTKALSRVHLDKTAAEALSAYGVEARQAIPAIINAHPLSRGDSAFLDTAEEALQHIGPPREADIPLLCESLTRDEETRMVVARGVGLLGLNGKSAANALEAAAESSIKEYVRLTRSPKEELRKRLDNSGRVFLAAEDCAIAVWDVTHDAPRFLRLIEKLAIAADAPIFGYYAHRAVLADLSADDCRLIEKMLRHSNINVQQTALAVLCDVGPKAEPLKGVVLELARGKNAELSRKSVQTLATIGAKAGNDAEPILISKLRDGTIPLQQFADAVGRLEIRTAAIAAILESGLHDKDRRTATACATALCITSNEPRRIARLIVGAAREEFFTNRDAIESLISLKAGKDVVIPFLVGQLDSSDYWTRHDAINSLGSLAGKASQAITPLTKLLDDPSPLIRLKAAKALFLIAGKAAALEKQLDGAFASDDRADWCEAINTIAELNRSGGKFAHYASKELRRSPPVLAEEAIKALQAIGTEEAVTALRTTAESSDWKLRSQAVEALKQIEKSDGKGGK